MKEILFKIRKNYEQNRKFYVVKVETLLGTLHDWESILIADGLIHQIKFKITVNLRKQLLLLVTIVDIGTYTFHIPVETSKLSSKIKSGN